MKFTNERKIKLLILNQHISDGIGGSELQCHNIAENIGNYGINIIYGVMNPRSDLYNQGYKIFPLGGVYLSSLINCFKRNVPDVVYWRANRSKLLYTVLISKWYRAKFFYAIASKEDVQMLMLNPLKRTGRKLTGFNIHSFFNCCFGAKQMVMDFINYFAFFFVDHVIYMNDDFKNKLPVRNQTKIYNSLGKQMVDSELKGEYIVWVSNMKRIKNPEICVKLANHFLNKDIGIRIVMVGKIKEKEYGFFNDPFKTPSNLEYKGFRSFEEVNGLISAAKFLIHTCDPEGFPNVFIQAWNFGKPTISLYYDPERIIEKNNLGFCSQSYERFCDDVERLLEDKVQYETFCANAKKFADQYLDVQKNCQKLAKVIKEFKN